MDSPSGRTGNLLLDSVPRDASDRLLNGIAPSTIEQDDVVQPPTAPIENVMFPTAGVASVLTLVLNQANHGARSVEAVTVGREGMTNIHAALGVTMSGPETTVIQVDGKAFVVPIRRVTEEMDRRGAFADVVHRYVQAFWAQTAYGSACNAVHHVTTRCARWLLQTTTGLTAIGSTSRRSTSGTCSGPSGRPSPLPRASYSDVGSSNTRAGMSRSWTGRRSRASPASATRGSAPNSTASRRWIDSSACPAA
jgi:hypothetical protein